MKRILVLVADKRELSKPVLDFLEVNNVKIVCTGVGGQEVFKALLTKDFSEYDEVWNVGSVGSSLPLYTVFEVGRVYSYGEFKGVLSDSTFFVDTVDSFKSSDTDFYPYRSSDMELAYIVDFVNDFGHIPLRSFKYVSDNMKETFTIEDWYKTIDETAFIVSEPLIQILKKYIK